MRKYIALLLAALLAVFALAACGGGQQEKATEEETQTEEEQQTGIANPWSDVATAEEAAEGAGLDTFTIEEGEISLGEMKVNQYRCMDGLAEAIIEFPAVEMTIRKGKAEMAAESNNVANGDISGDYNEYKNNWTQNIKGLEVQCYGNREGDATKTIWTSGDYCWSICVQGLGGDDDYGLSADDLNTIINGLQ